jgi:hypothetical protein
MDDYLSAIDDISKESYVDNARLGCVGMWGIRRWREYITIVLKRSLLTMAFSTHRACLNRRVFFSNWDLWPILGEGQCYSAKTYTTPY